MPDSLDDKLANVEVELDAIAKILANQYKSPWDFVFAVVKFEKELGAISQKARTN